MIKDKFARLRSAIGSRVKSFGRKAGNIITAPLRKEAQFRNTVRQNDPAYQRGQTANYLRNYDRYKRGEIDEYGN